MNTASTTQLVTVAFSDLGSQIFIILGLVIGLGIALLVFRYGWRNIHQLFQGFYIDSETGLYKNDPMQIEYETGLKKGYWKSYDSYLND
jgi:hypothetical protein